MSKDYYKILGVAEFESAENIKSAYRKLARKYHPDVAGNTSEAVLRFKDINEAYSVLSNKVKREEYDRARRFYNYAKESKTETSNKTQEKTNNNTNPQREKAKSFYFNWEDFIYKRNQEENIKKESSLNAKRGEDIYTEIEISIFEALSGTTKTINMLQTQICPKCGGRKFVNGTICKHCSGKGETTSYKKFNVKIPPEVKDKSKIRLAGEGANGVNGGKNGDLYITIKINAPCNYETKGLNIYKKIPITPFEAVLGGSISVKTPEGRVNVKLAPNTQNGQKIRLSGCGVVQNSNVGDMIITVEINIPKNLSKEEIDLYKKLGEISKSNIREGIN